METNLKEDLDMLYDNLLSAGYEMEHAQTICNDYCTNHAAREEIKGHINLRRQFPLSKIAELSYVKQRGGYKKLTDQERDTLMWLLGIDSRGYKYTTDVGYYVFNDRKHFGEFVVGQERSDKEWVNQTIGEIRVSSYEALLKHKGHFKLMSEINRMLAGHE